MVALFLGVLSVFAWAQSEQRLATECDKSQAYLGEIVNCQYILYSPENQIEVEVAKFPEFRGFWSENSALRQGPMSLLPEFHYPGLQKALIGSYQLIAMRSNEPPQIVPMRVVVRSRGFGGGGEETLLSEAPPIHWKPLPSPPAALAAAFDGAVGQFTLRVETPVVRFSPNQPATLRYVLTGSGNYPEIDSLKPILPPGVSVISAQSTVLGSGLSQAKRFEINITVASASAYEVPPVPLTYFFPLLNEFQQTYSEAIRLEPLPLSTLSPDENQEILLGPIRNTPSPSLPVLQQTAFWGSQIALFALWFALLVRASLQRWQNKRLRNPLFLLKQRWKELLELEPSEPEGWLRQTEGLVFETICARAGKTLITRKQAVEFAREKWGDATARPIHELVQEVENIYRLTPTDVPPMEAWHKRLKGLRRTLFGQFASARKHNKKSLD
jgi:hypothetical protein